MESIPKGHPLACIMIGAMVISEGAFTLLMLPAKFQQYGIVVGCVGAVLWLACAGLHLSHLIAMVRALCAQVVRGLQWLTAKAEKQIGRLDVAKERFEKLVSKYID